MSDEIQKRYYSIGEVAEQLGVTASLIRHWETEFDVLRPKKNKKGDRQFTHKDIARLHMIYQLVKEQGYTLQGARDVIKFKVKEQNEKAALVESLERLKAFLTAFRDSL